MSHVKIAVFPVAGLGTRFLPATRSVPKELIPLVDRPLIDYAVEEARLAGIEEFVFVTSPGKTALEDHFGAAPELERRLAEGEKTAALTALRRSRLPEGSHAFVRQDQPRGLGHAVSLARRVVGNRPVAVLLPDDVIRAPRPCLGQLIDAHEREGGHVVAAMEVPRAQVSSYGILDVRQQTDALARARGLVEKPDPSVAPSNLAVVGRYILSPCIFETLARTAPGAGGEIQLTDAITADAASVPVAGYRFTGERFDCGTVAGHLAATIAFAMERPELAKAMSCQFFDHATGQAAA